MHISEGKRELSIFRASNRKQKSRAIYKELIYILELVKCRTRLDPAIASRSHTLLRVWAANSPATDLLAWGTFGMELKNGKRVVFDFTARFVVGFEKAKEDGGVEGEGQREEGEQKFEYVRVWTDPTKMLEALKKANEELKSDS